MTSLKISDLKIHPKNEYYFDDIQGEKWDRLLESIRTNGVRTPIIVTDDMTVVSGNQRVRACKQLGISVINAEVQHYQSEDDVIRDLIEINIRQRGVIDDSEIKQGRRFEFLKNYYGVKQGNNKNRTENNFPSKTSEEIAKESGVTKQTMDNYVRLSKAIPEIQDLVETGKVSPTTALSILRQLPEDEQKKLALAVAGTEEKVTNSQVQELINKLQTAERDLAEKDKKISELENREPIVKIKEVTPPDYEDMKRSVDNYQKEAIRIQKEKKKMSEKNAELTERIRDLESRKDIDALRKKVKEEAGYFAIRTYKYIQENGGCVWIFQKIDELSDKERKDFIDAIYSADAFIKQMIENLGGYGIE